MSNAKERVVAPVVDITGKEVEKFELDTRVFDGRVSEGSIYRAVHNYRANKRVGTASTKTRADVSGGGKKPWRQKGTGRARVGSSRNPLWTHGGIVFGPHPRDFSYTLPKKIKKLALRSVLNNYVQNHQLVVINSLALTSNKTKSFAQILKKLNINDKVLVVLSALDDNITFASRNIPFVQLVEGRNLNAYDALISQKILITKDALEAVTRRLK